MLFGFGQSADINIKLDNEESRKVAKIRSEDGQMGTHFLFYDGETVSGTVNIALKKAGQKMEHQGIRIEFIGQIEVYYDRGNQHDFISLTNDLARPGELTGNTSYRFAFNNVEKPYESYTGTNVRLRYFLRVTIVRRLSDITRDMDLIVHTLSAYPNTDSNIKMEVGIEDCLHIEFEYNKNKYHLRDVIVGKIYFLLVRIKIKYMEVAIIKTESVGSGPNIFRENETVAKFEIMDGAPQRRIDPYSTVPGRLRSDANDARYRQEVQCEISAESRSCRRRRSPLLQAAGGNSLAKGRLSSAEKRDCSGPRCSRH